MRIEAPNGIAAPISPKRWRIAASATRRAISCRRSTTGASSPARSRRAGAPTTSPPTQHGIGAWSDAELAQYLSQGHADGRGTAAGPMGEAVDLSLRHLTHDDIAAMVAYLRTVPPIASADLPAPNDMTAPACAPEGRGGELHPAR